MADSSAKQSAGEVLARIVDTAAPQRLLSCGTTANEVSQRWLACNPALQLALFEPPQAQDAIAAMAGADLALVSDTLDQLDQAEGSRLLGLLRNYGTQRIAVLVASDGRWQLNELVALGFRRHVELSDGLTLYSYKLDSYNHKRNWNNPRNWANPEMWDKARW